MRLHPLLPRRSPTLSELARTPADSPSSSRATGLFCNLVGLPEVMLDDLLRDPEKYEAGVADLLQDLTSGRRQLQSLDTTEMAVLDRATLDFSRSSSKKQSESSPPPSPLKKQSSSFEEMEERDIPDDEGPDESVVPHWFR